MSEQHFGECKDDIEQNINEALLCRKRLESDIEMKKKMLANTTCRLKSKEGEVLIWEGLVKNAHTEYIKKRTNLLRIGVKM